MAAITASILIAIMAITITIILTIAGTIGTDKSQPVRSRMKFSVWSGPRLEELLKCGTREREVCFVLTYFCL